MKNNKRNYLPFLVVRGGVLGGVTKVKDVCEEDSDGAPAIELLLAGEKDCLAPTPTATGEPCLGEPLLGEPVTPGTSVKFLLL